MALAFSDGSGPPAATFVADRALAPVDRARANNARPVGSHRVYARVLERGSICCGCVDVISRPRSPGARVNPCRAATTRSACNVSAGAAGTYSAISTPARGDALASRPKTSSDAVCGLLRCVAAATAGSGEGTECYEENYFKIDAWNGGSTSKGHASGALWVAGIFNGQVDLGLSGAKGVRTSAGQQDAVLMRLDP